MHIIFKRFSSDVDRCAFLIDNRNAQCETNNGTTVFVTLWLQNVTQLKKIHHTLADNFARCRIITARRYAGVVYAAVVCSSVRPCVTSREFHQNGLTSRKQHRTIAQYNYLSSGAKDLGEIPMGSLPRGSGAKYRGGLKSAVFDQYLARPTFQKRCNIGT